MTLLVLVFVLLKGLCFCSWPLEGEVGGSAEPGDLGTLPPHWDMNERTVKKSQ